MSIYINSYSHISINTEFALKKHFTIYHHKKIALSTRLAQFNILTVVKTIKNHKVSHKYLTKLNDVMYVYKKNDLTQKKKSFLIIFKKKTYKSQNGFDMKI